MGKECSDEGHRQKKSMSIVEICEWEHIFRAM